MINMALVVCGLIFIVTPWATHEPDPVARAGFGAVGGLLLGTGGMMSILGFIDKRKAKRGARKAKADFKNMASLNAPLATKTPGATKGGQTHCHSCGKPLVQWRYQYGFSGDGQPNISTDWRCPDWVQNPYDLHSVDCQNVVQKPLTRVSSMAHPDHTKHTAVDFGCPDCLDELVRKGVLSDQEAKQFR